MRDQPVVASGPLGVYRDGFVEELAAQGYRERSAAQQLLLMTHLSHWLDSQGLCADALVGARVEEFIERRRAEGYRFGRSEQALKPLLGYLQRLGVAPAPVEPRPSRRVEILLGEYARYLAHERGLAPSSVERYLGTARLFLSGRERGGELDVDGLTAADVTAFVVDQCRSRPVGSAKVTVTALRSLLRFLFLEGYITCPLDKAVPTVTGWADRTLPRPLGGDAVAALYDSCDVDSLVGARDLAIIAVLARLGLRAGEVAALSLDDIDWRHGEIAVKGKGAVQERLPLPVDVGEAMAAYLRRRPKVPSRAVFLRVHAPVKGLTPGGVEDVVRGSCKRAGLPQAGPHRLRHYAATAMLRGGASLAEVGQALRHARQTTTNLYAKVDRLALASIARPWPGGAK